MDREQRKARAESLKGREVRLVVTQPFEVRDIGDGQFNISGCASVTDTPYEMGFYTETIRSGAFTQTLNNRPDVQLLVNHTGLPLARTVSGTLRLSEGDNGLNFDADVDQGMSAAQDVRIAAGRGDMDQCSFAFCGARSEWDEDYTQREIVSLDIHRGDVSVVNQGANPATSFSMRSFIDRLIEPSDEALAELRELFGPDDLQAAFATLARLAPAEEVPEEASRLSLDFYRARAYQLRARGVTV